MGNKKINWSVIQPLNGGMPIGFEWELGEPKYIVSNNNGNDTYYLDYVKQRNLNSKIIKMDWDLKEYFEEDSDISKEEFEKQKEVDIVCAVPVCAGLSMLNAQKACPDKECDMGRGNPDNVQNQNMYNVTRFVLNNIKPKVYVFENAPTAYTKLGQGVIEKLKQIAKEAGYSVTVEKVNTINHGIPQKRERTFVYFFKGPNAYLLNLEHQETPDILSFFKKWIDKDATLQDEYVREKADIRDPAWLYIEEKVAKPQGKTVFEIAIELEGDKITSSMKVIEKLNAFNELYDFIDDLIAKETDNEDEEEIKKLKKFKDKTKFIENKLKMNKGYWDISNIFSTNGSHYNAFISKSAPFIIHPNGKRTLNKREMLSLMGMPNDYEIKEEKAKFVSMLSQSVPTCTAQHAAKNCRLFVEGKLKKASSNFVKQNNIKLKTDLGEPALTEEEW